MKNLLKLLLFFAVIGLWLITTPLHTYNFYIGVQHLMLVVASWLSPSFGLLDAQQDLTGMVAVVTTFIFWWAITLMGIAYLGNWLWGWDKSTKTPE